MRRLVFVTVMTLGGALGPGAAALAAPPVSSGGFELPQASCSTAVGFPAGPHTLRADFAATADGDDDVQVGDTITYTYAWDPNASISFDSSWTIDLLLPSGPVQLTAEIDPFTGGEVVSSVVTVQPGDAGTVLAAAITQVSVLNESNGVTVTCTPPGGNTIDLYVNTPPTALGDEAVTTAGAPVETDVMANDDVAATMDSGTSDGPDQDGLLQDDEALTGPLQIVTDATDGSCLATPGGIEYAPDAGFTGLDGCVYSIADNDGAVATATLDVTVEAPAISLVTTVGTDPGTCATESSITVPTGTTVYYCYTVTNDSTITYGLHDLVDDRLGVLLDDLAFELAPGATVDTVSAGLTVDAVVTEDTTNTGTWIAVDDDLGIEAQAEAQATVDVADPAIALVTTVGTDPGTCATVSSITVPTGATVYYCYTVTNTGDVAVPVHDLEDSELGVLLDGFAFDLAPGATVDTVAAGLTVDAVISASTTNTATWTGSGPDLVVTATATATVETADASIGLVTTVGTDPAACGTESSISVDSGTAVYYCYTVTNTGDVTLGIHSLVDDRLGTILDGFAFALEPGASVDTVTAGVTASAVVDADTTNAAVWTAVGEGSSASAQAQATVRVTEPPATAEPGLTPTPGPEQAPAPTPAPSPTPTGSGIAATGSPTGTLALFAFTLILTGATLLVANGRRRRVDG